MPKDVSDDAQHQPEFLNLSDSFSDEYAEYVDQRYQEYLDHLSLLNDKIEKDLNDA